MKLIEEALDRGDKALSEYDSKRFLAHYGIPVTPEADAATMEDAVRAAGEIGYPVVLKGLGADLTHKTELDLVRLNVSSEDGVRQAYQELTASQKARVERVLVQKMVKGERELVAGLTRDPQFGPCVMFGLGGIFTEILKDVAFRVAPLERRDALEMLDDFKAHKILEAFRGKPAAHREKLADILVALGRIGLENPGVAEIDINPLKLEDGAPVAVDALVVLNQG